MRISVAMIDCRATPDRAKLLSRGRSHTKRNDVREPVGYRRHENPAELAMLNEIWKLERVFTNYLLPRQKLVFTRRNRAQMTKR
ncbi:MAG: hypothetical protein H7288_15975 [Kineosporiaceae bacterium]|nr:hypothetical protein [Aeromicrobium sp.]